MPADLLGVLGLTKSVAALPRRLGALQFWRGEIPMLAAMEPAYAEAARRAERILMGDKAE